MKQILFFLFTVMLALALPSAVFSHKVTVFAYAEGDTIMGEAQFSGGRPAKEAKITVENAADGTSYLTTVTDEQGLFSFPVPAEAKRAQAELRIVLLAGEAHRNDYLLTASEYLPKSSARQPVTENGTAESPIISTKGAPLDAAQERFIRQLVRDTVAAEMAPIKQRLRAQATQGPTLRDILGGIGVIFGVAGLIAYYQSRRRRNS